MQFSKQLVLQLALLLTLTVSGCVLDEIDVNVDDKYVCQSNDDCVDKFECVMGFCKQKTTTLDCTDSDGDTYFVGTDFAACVDDPSKAVLDCNDMASTINPGAIETCNDVDDNCDGNKDEGIDSVACPLSLGVCSAVMAVQTCQGGALVPADCTTGCPGPDCIYGPDFVLDEGVENCDAKDNDCDGTEDETCPTCVLGEMCNSNGLCTNPGACACQPGTKVCDPIEACVDDMGNPVIAPFLQQETCGNAIDDICDGQIDEGC